MKFPSIKDVASTLAGIKQAHLNKECPETEVRLQVVPTGGYGDTWTVRWGDPQYDLDHRGYWGNSFLDQRTNCRELAKNLIEQARENYAVISNVEDNAGDGTQGRSPQNWTIKTKERAHENL